MESERRYVDGLQDMLDLYAAPMLSGSSNTTTGVTDSDKNVLVPLFESVRVLHKLHFTMANSMEGSKTPLNVFLGHSKFLKL